jgi:hypothetical protein
VLGREYFSLKLLGGVMRVGRDVCWTLLYGIKGVCKDGLNYSALFL